MDIGKPLFGPIDYQEYDCHDYNGPFGPLSACDAAMFGSIYPSHSFDCPVTNAAMAGL